MNFEDEEDWDLELIDNLVRKEEEAISARRSSQAVPPVSQPPPLPFLWSGLNKKELEQSSQQQQHPQYHHFQSSQPQQQQQQQHHDFSASQQQHQHFQSSQQQHFQSSQQQHFQSSQQPHHQHYQSSQQPQYQHHQSSQQQHKQPFHSYQSSQQQHQQKQPQKTQQYQYLQSSQQPHKHQHHHQKQQEPLSSSHPSSFSGTQNDVVSELRQRLLQAEQEVIELRKKVVQPAVNTQSTNGQELERLREQILFKDQEILETRRAFAEKSDQLKKVTNEVSELRKKFEAQSHPVKRQLEDVEEERPKERGSINNAGRVPAASQAAPNKDLWFPPWKPSGHPPKPNKTTHTKNAEPSLVGKLKSRTRSNGCIPSFQKETKNSCFQAQNVSKTTSIGRDPQSRQESNKDNHLSKRSWDEVLRGKLVKIWCSSDVKGDSIRLISKLFTVCLGDMQVLLSFDASKGTNKTDLTSVKKVATALLSGNVELKGASSEELDLHSMLFKMANGAIPSWTFFIAVLEFCDVENIQVCESALHVLHCILINDEKCRNQLLGMDTSWLPTGLLHSGTASSVGSSSKDTTNLHTAVYSLQNSKVYSCSPRVYWSFSESPASANRFSDNSTDIKGPDSGTEPAKENCIRIFKRILSKATKGSNQSTQSAAMAILIGLVMNSEAIKQRESFGFVIFDGSISTLLKQSTDIDVQLQAVRLLYILLHCPGIMKKLCVEELEPGELRGKNENESCKIGSKILNGLISCLFHKGKKLQEYSLCRNALRVLTFIATSGPKGAIFLLSNSNFLSAEDKLEGLRESESQKGSMDTMSRSLPVQLVHLLDQELQRDEEMPNITEIEERECMIRETLTLLCRLASHSAVNVITLEALTSDKALARLSISVTKRLINRGALLEAVKLQGKHGVVSSSDLIELARGLRRRILESVSNL